MISKSSRISNNNNSKNEYDLYIYYGGSVFVGLLTLSVFYWKKRVNVKNSGYHGKKIVKSTVEYAKGYNMLGVLRNSGAGNSPNYVLQMTRDVYKNQNLLTYRLPLPIPGGVYVVGDIEMAVHVLTDPLTDKSSTYKSINMILGVSENIFTSSNFLSTKEKKSGATICHWKSIRKATATSFSSTEIKRMKDIVQYHAEQWCVRTKEQMSLLQQQQQQEETKTSSIIIDPVQEMIHITFNIICEAALEYKATDNDFQEFTSNHQIAFRELFIKNCINPFRALYGYIVSSEVRKAHKCCKELQQLAHKILIAYKNNPTKSTQNTVIKAITSIPNLSIKEQIGEVLVFLVAGHDTTGLSIANTLCLLGQNQQIQTKLLNEVRANNVQDQPLEWSKHVQYFTCIVKETHRYMPVTALGSSRCIGKEYIVSSTSTADTTSSGSTRNKNETTIIHQRYIPKGATIFLPQIVYTRNEQIFPNADIYNPDRWMTKKHKSDSSTNNEITITGKEENNKEQKEQEAYDDDNDVENVKIQRLQNLSILPFAIGSRNCIGQALALTELDIVLPIILSKFHIAIQERGFEDYFTTWKFTNSRLHLTERI